MDQKLYFTGIVERGSDGYYVSFPDLPGCIGAGDTMLDAAANAEGALLLHLSGMADDGEFVPLPTDPDKLPADPDVVEAGRLVIGVSVEAAEKVRVNVMLDRNLLAAIDATSDNRSRFLADAARERLRAGR